MLMSHFIMIQELVVIDTDVQASWDTQYTGWLCLHWLTDGDAKVRPVM